MKNEKDKNKNSDGEGAKEKSFKKNTSQINKDEKNGETSNGNRGSEISDSQKSGKKDKSNSVDTLIGYVVLASIIIGLLSGVYKFIWYGDLDIYAIPKMLSSESEKLKSSQIVKEVDGAVYWRGEPVNNATVSIVAIDINNNRLVTSYTKTQTEGKFNLKLNPSNTQIKSINVFAKSPASLKYGITGKESEISISLGKSPVELLKGKSLIGILLIIFFVISLLLAFVYNYSPKIIYFLIIICAVSITCLMVYYVGSGLQILTTPVEGRIIKLGFANIYNGTYVKGVQEEPLFSLTSPDIELISEKSASDSSSEPYVSHGLGAPLWVIFLSVLGSSLFTLSVIIKEILNPVLFHNSTDERKRIHKIIQHQFFILFSPVSGIIIYQTLVLGKAASEPITVALAALGAGVSLNIILERGAKTSERILDRGEDNT